MNSSIKTSFISSKEKTSFSVSPHPCHERLQQIELSESVINAFLHQVKDVNVQNLEYVPYSRFCLADTLSKVAGRELKHFIQTTVTDPVNEMALTRGCSTMACPTLEPGPLTKLNTPALTVSPMPSARVFPSSLESK